MKHSRAITIASLWLVLFLISACGSFEVGIEHVPPSSGGDIDWRATAEALQAEATRVAPNVQSPLPVLAAAPAPTLVPTALPPAHEAATVAYVQGGDIWVKNLPDGEAVRLTHDGRNRLPNWSASGEWLTFLKDSEGDQLWIMRRDGSDASQLGNQIGESHAWSPVADVLAAGETGGINLFMPESGMQRVLPGEEVEPGTIRRLGKIAWSPDGQWLAYTETVREPNSEVVQDALWVASIDPLSLPTKIVAGDMPEAGEIILHGWSGDGNYLLYWQAPVQSASILADGVPMYRVSASGGTPQVIAENVLPYEDAVQSQPNGLSQVAIVEGSGRVMWYNKQLRSVVISGTQEWELTPPDQAISSPAWSPAGSAIAYIGTPNLEGVGGGPRAEAALKLRRLWIVESNEGRPQQLKVWEDEDSGYREEAPQWIDDETLLVARMDLDGRVSLWQVSRSGNEEQEVVREITPAPEWFGNYGHIRWREYFALWRPRTVAQEAVATALPPTLIPTLVPTPTRPCCVYRLVDFWVGIEQNLTLDEALSRWAGAEVSGGTIDDAGNQLQFLQYILTDGTRIRLGFPEGQSLAHIQLQAPHGSTYALIPLEEFSEMASAASHPTPPALFGTVTATPVGRQSPIATPTPTPAAHMPVPASATPDRVLVTLTPTATPVPVEEATATPFATQEPTVPPPTEMTPIATMPPVAAEYVVHVVQEGDTLMSIAEQYGVTAQRILEASGITAPELIRVGDELIIPVLPTPTPVPSPTPTLAT